MNSWSFSKITDLARLRRLETSPPFERIAQQVATSMRILCTHSDPCDEAAGYKRLVCCVTVDRDLFDLLFNAEYGYRGSYFVSPELGLRANSHLLALVAPALVVHEAHADLPPRQSEASLRAESAKCWLAEVGKGFCPVCEGEWTTPQGAEAEILNGRWEHGNEPKARYGRKAPRFTKLRFLGAFVDATGDEYVTTQKRDRAEQIFKFGWS